jgi:signal transduction histidine kinase
MAPWDWPVAVKVPAIVALLMILVSAVITNVVGRRLAEIQEQHLSELAGAYLDGLSSAIEPHVLRQDVWEVFDALDRSAALYQGLEVVWTTVTDEAGAVIASSKPEEFVSQQPMPRVALDRFTARASMAISSSDNRAHVQRELDYQGRRIGAIHAEIDITALMRIRSNVLLTLVMTNAGLTLLFAALGYVTVRWMLQPVRILSQHLERSRRGPIAPIPRLLIGRRNSEFGRLFRRYNALVTVVAEREQLDAKLAEEEKLASLGRLASGMAHEINNPLGGMLNALDSLKRHGDRASVRETSIRLIEQGLLGIRDLVRSTLMTYRSERRGHDLTRADIDDLRLLVKPEMKRKGLECGWLVEIDGPLAVPAGLVRDAILNLLLNACQASPANSIIGLSARTHADHLVVEVDDAGPGLPDAVRAYLEEPGAGRAPIDGRGGLGLWMVKRLVEEWGGSIRAEGRAQRGTRIVLRLRIGQMERRHAA